MTRLCVRFLTNRQTWASHLIQLDMGSLVLDASSGSASNRCAHQRGVRPGVGCLRQQTPRLACIIGLTPLVESSMDWPTPRRKDRQNDQTKGQNYNYSEFAIAKRTLAGKVLGSVDFFRFFRRIPLTCRSDRHILRTCRLWLIFFDTSCCRQYAFCRQTIY